MRLAFVVLTMVLAVLDVDSAFTSGDADAAAMLVAAVIFAGWFAVYARLVVLVRRPSR